MQDILLLRSCIELDRFLFEAKVGLWRSKSDATPEFRFKITTDACVWSMFKTVQIHSKNLWYSNFIEKEYLIISSWSKILYELKIAINFIIVLYLMETVTLFIWFLADLIILIYMCVCWLECEKNPWFHRVALE